jgi:signal transduction histidine kinase
MATVDQLPEEKRSARGPRRQALADGTELRSIVERMADGVIIVGLDGIIRFANPAAEQLFGRTAADLKGRDLGFPVVVGERAEVEVVRPQGRTVTAELRVVDIDWDGEGARLVSVRDVTDRKRAEERSAQLERERIARAEAEAASQAKSEFLAVMSHELRTPLNAVIGYAELLDLGIAGSLMPEQRQHVSRIRASGRHLLGLVNEVLDLAKVEAGRLSLQHGVASTAHTIDGAMSLIQPMGEARGIAVQAKSSVGNDVLYEGDEDRVRQILVNLLTNALKFTAAGGRVSAVWGVTADPDRDARLSGAGPWVVVRVEDTGIGIPSDQIACIFDPFTQVEGGHTRSSDGSGLGLTISRRLARLMKGDLTVRSELGKGSVFTLWLPEASATAKDDARWRSESPDAAARLQGLSDVGEVLLRELNPLVDSFVARLRSESIIPNADSIRSSQLADHLAAFMADVAGMLMAIEEGRGQPSSLVADAGEIQRVVAERHGAQRARLGWTPNALHREWAILREEITRVIRRRARSISERAVAESQIVIERFLEQSEEVSQRALSRATEEAASDTLVRRQPPESQSDGAEARL